MEELEERHQVEIKVRREGSGLGTMEERRGRGTAKGEEKRKGVETKIMLPGLQAKNQTLII